MLTPVATRQVSRSFERNQRQGMADYWCSRPFDQYPLWARSRRPRVAANRLSNRTADRTFHTLVIGLATVRPTAMLFRQQLP